MPPDDYIPAADAEKRDWMNTFAAGISASPATYGLAFADAAAIQSAVDAFDAAYLIAVDPATRTPVTVNEKDTARNAAEQICRQFALIIKHDGGVTDADKIAIGVRPINDDREPIDCPQTSPIVAIIAATPGVHTLRYADSMTPDSPAKPFGATELQLFVNVGEESNPDPTGARFVGKFTKNPVSVSFEQEDNGKMATYFARWSSRRGDVGPWSVPVSLAIAS